MAMSETSLIPGVLQETMDDQFKSSANQIPTSTGRSVQRGSTAME